MNESNLLWGAAGAGIVWWLLSRKDCHCADGGDHHATTTPPAPAAAPPSILPPPIDTSPQYLPPVCPADFLVGEGGSCYRTTMRTVPGYSVPIPYTDVATPVCPPGYQRQASSGSCVRSS